MTEPRRGSTTQDGSSSWVERAIAALSADDMPAARAALGVGEGIGDEAVRQAIAALRLGYLHAVEGLWDQAHEPLAEAAEVMKGSTDPVVIEQFRVTRVAAHSAFLLAHGQPAAAAQELAGIAPELAGMRSQGGVQASIAAWLGFIEQRARFHAAFGIGDTRAARAAAIRGRDQLRAWARATGEEAGGTLAEHAWTVETANTHALGELMRYAASQAAQELAVADAAAEALAAAPRDDHDRFWLAQRDALTALAEFADKVVFTRGGTDEATVDRIAELDIAGKVTQMRTLEVDEGAVAYNEWLEATARELTSAAGSAARADKGSFGKFSGLLAAVVGFAISVGGIRLAGIDNGIAQFVLMMLGLVLGLAAGFGYSANRFSPLIKTATDAVVKLHALGSSSDEGTQEDGTGDEEGKEAGGEEGAAAGSGGGERTAAPGAGTG
jgi:hypothetical protein